MTYRTIVHELRDAPGREARARVATALARRFGAELVAVHVAPAPGSPPAGLAEAGALPHTGLADARRAEDAKAQARTSEALARAASATDVPTREIYLEDADGEALPRLARTADLTIVGPPPGDKMAAPSAQPIDQLLVGAAGPVLVLPRAPGELPAARVLFAWDGGRRAARALRDALPLLLEAEEVVVLALGEAAARDLDAAAARLARHGARARAERRPAQGRTGDQLLAVARELGAGLLVMGAYDGSRLRQAVFGGATRDVLGRADLLPVLFSC